MYGMAYDALGHKAKTKIIHNFARDKLSFASNLLLLASIEHWAIWHFFLHYLSQLLTTNVRKHKWNIRFFLFLYLKISITWIHESYAIKATFLCFSCFTIGFWSRCVFAQHTFISDNNINTRSLVFLLCFFIINH